MPKRSWAASAMPTETFWRRRRDDSTPTRNLSTCENEKKLNSYTRFLDLVATTLALDLVVLGLQMFRVVVSLVLDM